MGIDHVWPQTVGLMQVFRVDAVGGPQPGHDGLVVAIRAERVSRDSDSAPCSSDRM